jgi:hypothetical protein
MCVEPRQDQLHHFGPGRTELLMVGPADHHQFGMLRIGIPEAFRTCDRGPAISRSLNEEHGCLAAAYRRDAILDPFHIEAVVQSDPQERRFDQRTPDHSCGPLGYSTTNGVRTYELASITIKGSNSYRANPNTEGNPLGTLASIRYHIEGIDQDVKNISKRIEEATAERRELQALISRPFEHEEKLKELLAKQLQLNNELDLNKNQAGTENIEQEKPAEEPEKAVDPEDGEEESGETDPAVQSQSTQQEPTDGAQAETEVVYGNPHPVYPQRIVVGDRIFSAQYGYQTVEKVYPPDPKYPKVVVLDLSRELNKQYPTDRPVTVESQTKSGPELSQKVDPPEEAGSNKLPTALKDLLIGAEAEKVDRSGAQLADTLKVNAHAAEVLRQAYRLGGGEEMGSIEGAAAQAGHARIMLKGLEDMARSPKLPPAARQAALRLTIELRKASAGGTERVAIATPEAQTHEHLHFAIEKMKFDPDVILQDPETRVAFTRAQLLGLAHGSEARVIREVMTRIANYEHESLKLDPATGRRILVKFLANSVHDEAEIDTLKELAHEQLKDTIAKAGQGRSLDAGAAIPAREEPGPPADYRARPGSGSGNGGVGPGAGGASGEEAGEGPELARRVAKPDEGDARVSRLSAAKDKFVRNLSQLEKVPHAEEVHGAAVQAATSRAQTAALIRAAAPRVDDALSKGHKDPVSWLDFRRTLIESNLRGRRDRWNHLAEGAETSTDDDLPAFFARWLHALKAIHEESMGEPLDSPAITAAAYLDRGDMAGLREFLVDTFERAAGRVARMMDNAEYDKITGHPGFAGGLKVYKALIEQPVRANHQENEGVLSDALGPLNTYYPLIRLEEEAHPKKGPNGQAALPQTAQPRQLLFDRARRSLRSVDGSAERPAARCVPDQQQSPPGANPGGLRARPAARAFRASAGNDSCPRPGLQSRRRTH